MWLRGGARLTPLTMEVPGDVSSAAFLVVAALILPESWIHIENVLLNPARTAFLDDIGGNLKPARALGMATIKVDDPERALVELGVMLGLDLLGAAPPDSPRSGRPA